MPSTEQEPAPDDLYLAVIGDDLLVDADGALATVGNPPAGTDLWRVGTLDGRQVWSAEVTGVPGDRQRTRWQALAAAGDRHAALAARALHITAWRRAHRYCGACRRELVDVPGVMGVAAPAAA